MWKSADIVFRVYDRFSATALFRKMSSAVQRFHVDYSEHIALVPWCMTPCLFLLHLTYWLSFLTVVLKEKAYAAFIANDTIVS